MHQKKAHKRQCAVSPVSKQCVNIAVRSDALQSQERREVRTQHISGSWHRRGRNVESNVDSLFVLEWWMRWESYVQLDVGVQVVQRNRSTNLAIVFCDKVSSEI